MAIPRSRVTTQGQISVPAAVRRTLGIGPGSILEWDVEGEHVIVRKAGRYSSEDIHRAVFAKKPKQRTLTELKQGAGRYVEDKHAQR